MGEFEQRMARVEEQMQTQSEAARQKEAEKLRTRAAQTASLDSREVKTAEIWRTAQRVASILSQKKITQIPGEKPYKILTAKAFSKGWYYGDSFVDRNYRRRHCVVGWDLKVPVTHLHKGQGPDSGNDRDISAKPFLGSDVRIYFPIPNRQEEKEYTLVFGDYLSPGDPMQEERNDNEIMDGLASLVLRAGISNEFRNS